MDTREKLRRLLTEWSEFRMPALFERTFNDALLHDARILTLIGPRRAGKTFLCYQLVQRLRQSLPPGNVVYINFEDERLHPFNGDELTLLLDTQTELHDIAPQQPVYLFVDEVQNAPHWSKWARRVVEQNPQVRLVLTGSSSSLLSREIATELRGRARTFTVYPFSFAEYARARGADVTPAHLHTALRGRAGVALKKVFNQYLHTGGFPEAFTAADPAAILREYYGVMFYRDVIERYAVKNIRLLDDFLTLLIDQTACLTSVSATAKKLVACGYSLSKNTLTSFLRYATDIFLLFEARRHSYKIKQPLVAPRKIYAIDHALVKAIRFAGAEDYGRWLENIVFLELTRRGAAVYYHKHQRECDFLTGERGKIVSAIQVCRSLAEPHTRQREIAGLLEALTIYRLNKGLIITEDAHECVSVAGMQIEVVPAWYWLLGGSATNRVTGAAQSSDGK
jgi:predicted AAA+ superfamily ATPase